MGKDVEDCCAACKLVGETPPPVEPPIAPAPLRTDREDVTIIVMQGSLQIGAIKPTADRVRVGRVKDNDVVLPSGTISKRQCELVFKDGAVIVRDTGSTCGTVVGGRKIFEPTKLPEDGAIYVGDYQLRIVRD